MQILRVIQLLLNPNENFIKFIRCAHANAKLTISACMNFSHIKKSPDSPIHAHMRSQYVSVLRMSMKHFTTCPVHSSHIRVMCSGLCDVWVV